MINHQVITRYLLSFGMILIAGSVAYFSYALIYTVNRIPEVVSEIDKASVRVDAALESVDKVSGLIPPIVEQFDHIQRQMPDILLEVKANRELMPQILRESKEIRSSVPPILAEMSKVRAELPLVLKELEAYRALLPEIMSETKAIRETLPSTLDRVENLMVDARDTGQKASEGAVKGFFTGLIKMPFSVLGNIGNTLYPKSGLSDSDIKLINETVMKAIGEDKLNAIYDWNNTETDKSGEIQLLADSSTQDQACRKVRSTVNRKSTQFLSKDFEVCKNEKSEWEIIN